MANAENNPTETKSESLRPVAGELPVSAFVQRPNVGPIVFMLGSLAGVLVLLVWMLRPLPVTPVTGAALGAQQIEDVAKHIAFGVNRAARLCDEGTPAAGAQVQITVRADGSVGDVQASGPFASPATQDCVVTELRRLQLPPIQGGTRTFTHALGAPPGQ